MASEQIERKVIEEFGEQWTSFQENEGYYGSIALLKDLLGPLGSIEQFKNKIVAEIGSGTGRIVNMLAEAGASKIIAIEPSAAMFPLKENTRRISDRVIYLRQRGDEWKYPELDSVLSIGVLHHIFDPHPTIRNAFSNLKPGGKFIIWVYGKEGNELYLSLADPIRKLTTRLPHSLLWLLSWLLVLPLSLYTALCSVLPLPMRAYFLDHIKKLNWQSRHITIYDQLNPSWSRYYPREEAEKLLSLNGFTDVKSYHRHGYSWTVVGTKRL